VPDLTTAPSASYPSLPVSTSTPTATSAASAVKPEYVVAGLFAGLIAWLLVRRR
jgi:hypothetical protein